MQAKLVDLFNFLSKLSFRKLWNFVLIKCSFHYALLTKKPVLKGRPITISFEPTTACNLSCPECPSGQKSFSRPTGNLDPTFFKSVIDHMYRDLIYLIFYFQGEPYLNPQFLNMVKYAKEKKIYTISSTNAHFLSDSMAKKTVESGLDRLIISLDGTTQEVYESYRKSGDINRVINGAKHIVKWKKALKTHTPYVIFQFLVVKPNEHQISEAKMLARELGVDEIKFKSAQIYDFKHGNPLIPTLEKYSRYKKSRSGKYVIKNLMQNHCWKMWHSSVICWDGKVVPCCFDKDAKYTMGELGKESFEKIWHGRAYTDFRQGVFVNRKQIDICKNCTEGGKVWLR